MRIALGILSLFAITLMTTVAAHAADAKQFAPKNGMFTIMIPEGEHSGHQTRVMKIGEHTVPVEGAQCKMEDGTTFLGASVGLPAVVMRDVPADERFEILGDIIVKQLGGKIVAKKDVK